MGLVSRFGIAVALSLALCGATAAQSVAVQSTITGLLQQRRGESLSPVRRCTVYGSSASKGPLVGEYSDDKGRFRLEFPPDPAITVGVLCPGFRLSEVDGEPIEVAEQSELPVHDCSSAGQCADLQLVIEPLGVIEGELVDENGGPVEGAILALARETDVPEPPVFQAFADGRGYFRFFHIPPGEYELLLVDRSSAVSVSPDAGLVRVTVGAGDVVSVGRVRVPAREPAARPGPAARPFRPDQPEGPTDGHLVVRVRDSIGSPVPNARVFVQVVWAGRPVVRSATTDTDGQARFQDLPNGIFRIEAQLSGHSGPSRGRQVELVGPEASVAVDLQLARKPVLAGRVKDEHGTPMPETRIQLFELSTGYGVPTIVPSWSTTTDDRGAYRLSVPEAGRYWVMATHMEASFPLGSAPQPTGSVFYPNSPDMLGSQPADLAYDQPETIFDITLPPAPRTEFAAGLLSGLDGTPCAQCNFSVRRVEGAYDYELIGDAISGRLPGFEYRGIPAGHYRVYVEDQSRNALGWWAIEDVVLAEDRPVAVAISTQPPVAVAGRLTLEEPPYEWIVEHRGRADALEVQLTQVGDTYFTVRNASKSRAEMPPDGAGFALGPMPPGKFRVDLWAQGTDAYLADVAMQGRILPGPVLDFSQPGGWSTLELRVRFDMARPSIRIPEETRGDVWSTRRVVFVPDPNQNPYGHFTEGYCSPDGSCEISALPPGRYWVIAFASQTPGSLDLRELEVRNKLGAWGRGVDLRPGENPTMELKVAPAQAFEGL